MEATGGQSSAGAVKRGLTAATALAIPALPIGVLLGVAIRESDVVGNWAGWASSFLIFAGAAQFAAVELLDQGAGVAAVVAAVFMINARHLMYSAAIGGRFQEAPAWFKWIGSYFLIDQVFALNNEYAADAPSDRSLSYRIRFYLASAAPMASVWYVGVGAGILLGQFIPAAWEIEFAIPLMFLGLLVLSTFNLPGVVAAMIGGTVAVIGRGWPSGSGLLLGAVLGVAVAGVLDGLLSDSDATTAVEVEVEAAGDRVEDTP
ncbi:MAG: AzlC family ABC transporter permease [Acidimicrobiia bacterium]|nr:AzlC family ABC transporter permease [Acidimicrobiia bacterium]